MFTRGEKDAVWLRIWNCLLDGRSMLCRCMILRADVVALLETQQVT